MSVIAPAEINRDSPEAVLQWAFETFPRLVIVASFQAEASVLIDMASRIRADVTVLTLDTGRLPQQTYDMIDRVRDRYEIEVQVVSPDAGDLQEMVGRLGVNLFYKSPENRRLCCDVRKSRPLARALQGYDAWVTGVRRKQAATRAETSFVAPDPEHAGLTKIAPLAGWTKEQVWAYIHDHDLPYHSLYDSGYTSIGCEPCTRATTPGEDERAGRWWWESENEVKECGLHWAQPVVKR
ncbi:MAG TPA: phosphoadenylyl-sulfate reductase [Candidatus Dormibacteraeota bacterium]|nr:phosphoadenylyl-sulfate reductase [Candidatus Dormibacteraeota bacterium]